MLPLLFFIIFNLPHNVTKPKVALIGEIDVNDYQELEEFQIESHSLDVKQALIIEKKQDLHVVLRSFFIQNDIMEIPLCCMISMKVIRYALMNNILKLNGNFYFKLSPRVVIFYVFFRGLMDALLMSPRKGQTVGIMIGK
jgi:hypothetical protein